MDAPRDREARRAGSRERGGAQRDHPPVLRRIPDLPDRSLPGQGDRPEPAGLPLRERDVRVDVESRPRRERRDHRRREPRGGGPRRLLRSCRRAPGHGAEPRHAAPDSRRDGGARHLRRRRRPLREDQGAAVGIHHPARGRGSRSLRAGAGRGARRAGLSPRRRCRSGLHDGDVCSTPALDRQLALEGRALLPAHGQAHGPPALAGRRDLPPSARLPLRGRRRL